MTCFIVFIGYDTNNSKHDDEFYCIYVENA